VELDRTEIVIRKRSSLELLDLCLLVFRRHALKLAGAAAIFGLPLMALNVSLLQWMISADAVDELYKFSTYDSVELDFWFWCRYVTHLSILWIIVFPIASLPITVFLGAQLFYLPSGIKDWLRQLRELWKPIIKNLGFTRLGFAGIALELAIYRTFDFSFWEFVLLFLLFPLLLIFRGTQPFVPEIIGLERCEFRSKDPQIITYAKRRAALHRPLRSELINRLFAAGFFGTLLVMMSMGTILFLQATLIGGWRWNWYLYSLALPFCLWIVGIFLAIFRYLSYIDTRIRLEGWEIDLRMRAEALRMLQRESAMVETGSSDMAVGDV
jgi:hypothetical protein